MIVVDASALLEVLLRSATGARIERRLFAPGESLHAPHLVDVEIAQVVRRYAAAGDLSPTRGAEVLTDLVDFPLSRYPHDPLLPRIWTLRHHCTAYDAAYVALAEAMAAPLVTCDGKLAAAPGTRARFEVF